MPDHTVLTAPPTLFSDCPVPICTNPVDDGEPCAECSALLGEGLIRRTDASSFVPWKVTMQCGHHGTLNADPVTGGKRLVGTWISCWAVASGPHCQTQRKIIGAELPAPLPAPDEPTAAQDRGELYKPGQRCWCCTELKTCRRDPEQPGQWICKECEAIQP
jgi:hypothetical protein